QRSVAPVALEDVVPDVDRAVRVVVARLGPARVVEAPHGHPVVAVVIEAAALDAHVLEARASVVGADRDAAAPEAGHAAVVDADPRELHVTGEIDIEGDPDPGVRAAPRAGDDEVGDADPGDVDEVE